MAIIGLSLKLLSCLNWSELSFAAIASIKGWPTKSTVNDACSQKKSFQTEESHIIYQSLF
jgi:hypothetical protein